MDGCCRKTTLDDFTRSDIHWGGEPPGTTGRPMGRGSREDSGRRGNGLERNLVSRYSFGTSSHSHFIAHSLWKDVVHPGPGLTPSDKGVICASQCLTLLASVKWPDGKGDSWFQAVESPRKEIERQPSLPGCVVSCFVSVRPFSFFLWLFFSGSAPGLPSPLHSRILSSIP